MVLGNNKVKLLPSIVQQPSAKTTSPNMETPIPGIITNNIYGIPPESRVIVPNQTTNCDESVTQTLIKGKKFKIDM